MSQRLFGPTEHAERYREEALDLMGSFEFELCAECGRDADQHVLAPDALGLPHLYCLRGKKITATLKIVKRCSKCGRVLRKPWLADDEGERCARCGDS